jgi:hypothetical protein
MRYVIAYAVRTYGCSGSCDTLMPSGIEGHWCVGQEKMQARVLNEMTARHLRGCCYHGLVG